MLELGVLADDLTGGMMIASALEAVGVDCPLVTSTEALEAAPPTTEAVVLARKIRLIEPGAAQAEARAAAAAFERIGAKRIYQKYSALFDTKKHGVIGPIAEALLDATGAPWTIFCPAYVEHDVTVFQGRLFLRSTLLADSFKRHDPMTPAWSSDLVEVLQAQTRRKVGLIPHKAVLAGAEGIERSRARQEGVPFFIVDAADEEDMARLAEFALGLKVTTGGDSLPPAMARAWRGARAGASGGRRLLPPSPGLEVVLAGSCAPATLAQLETFERSHPVWRIDLARDGDTPDLAARILAWAKERVAAGPIAIATSAPPAGVAAAQARHGLDGAAQLADGVLGEVARGLFALGARKFVVAGGETSGAVLTALGARRLQVSAFDELSGGYCHVAAPEPTSLVIKAGGSGGEDFFEIALGRMREADRAGKDRTHG